MALLPAHFYEDRAKGRKQARSMKRMSPDEISVETWLGGYHYLFPDRRNDETTYNDYLMLRPFRRKYGGRRMSSITAIEAQAWTLQHPSHVRRLSAAWKMAVQMQVAPLNVWLFVVKPVRTKEKVRPPTDVELQAVLNACAEVNARSRGDWWAQFACMVEVAAFSGARQGGLIDLRRSHVDLRRRRMVVTEKYDKTRAMVLTGRAHAAMENQFLLRERLGWCPQQARKLSMPVWTNRTYTAPITGQMVQVAWRKVRGDFPHGFHALKHYCATWMRAQGLDKLDVAIQLGHTDSEGRPYHELIERVYDHPDHDEALARVAEGLDHQPTPIESETT